MARRRTNPIVVAALAFALFSSGAADVRTQEAAQPVVLMADTLRYDQASGIVSATGHVEVSIDRRILLTDELSFNERTGTIIASGNVSILQPNGDVIFADHVELDDRLSEGFLTGFRALLTDRSRFAANGARRTAGNRTEMTKVVYSACNLYGDRPPLWQIKAVKVIHDPSKQRVDYKDATLEFYGVPVAYLPFFSHADPSVKRKSGFLAPSYGTSSQLGLKIQVPYFFNLAPHRDVTFAPLFTSKEGVVLAGEYRQRVDAGQFKLDGSITRVDERDDNNAKTGNNVVRGHLFSTGRFKLNDTWRWGFDAARATDDTYLRRYDFNSEDTLTSNVFLEGFRNRNYASVNAFSFQGLREDDDPSQTPLILPLFEFSHVGEPGHGGQRASLNANLLFLTRAEGVDSQRLSVDLGWQLPHVSSRGGIYTLSADMGSDLYWVRNVLTSPSSAPKDTLTGRIQPQISLDWRLPLIRDVGTSRQVIEPIVTTIVSPYGGNLDTIPNEDSISFEFDDTNLFSTNRFPGIDRIEGGPRVNYGLKLGVYGAGGGYATFLVGQVLRAKDDDTFADKTGLENKRSDYVSRVNLVPSPLLDYSHRLRLDRDSFSIRRNEIKLSVGPKFLRANVEYTSLSRELTTDELESREEIALSSRAEFTKYWAATAQTRRDLTADGGTLNYGLGLIYEDECLSFTVDYERNFTRDRDVRPSTTVSFRIKLRNVG